ncbi:hypothetical protein OA162_04600, partial [Synechococcus sp. AH-736-A19]|nr:hypothetical protein [Synechococcus sp. AH-736-A19]
NTVLLVCRSTATMYSSISGEQQAITSLWEGYEHVSKHKRDSGLGRWRVRATEAFYLRSLEKDLVAELGPDRRDKVADSAV